MTKYLQTKRNSIEEAISSVVLDEKFSITLPPVRGGKKLLNIEMGRAIRMLKDFGATKSDIRNVLSGKGGRFQNANGEMFLVQRESVELDEAKFQVNYSKGGKLFSKTINAKDEDDAEEKAIKKFKIDDDDIRSVVKESLDEYTLTKLDKMMGIKKGDHVFFVSGSNAEGNVYAQNEKEAMEKAKKKGIRGRISVRDKGEYKGQPRLVNSVNEGYESEVLELLRKKGLEGAAYFKGGKLMVDKRELRDVKIALKKADFSPPKIVVEELDEDDKMMRLTKRQRQALSSPAAKGKGKGGITLPGAEFLSKKKKPMKVGRQSQVVKYEENEMDIVDTVRGIVEKKLDPVNPKAVKKKFDDRKDKDIDNDGDVDSTDKYLHKRRKAISKAIKNERVTDVAVDQAKRDLKHAKLKKATADVKNEVYDIGKDYAEHTLEVTPGQDKKDVDKMLNTAYTKNQGMREALAKVWGVNEGKSPFQKEEEKPLTKTMTGQKPTKVMVEPKMEKK